MMKHLSASMIAATLASLGHTALASDLEDAMAGGGVALTSDQIAELVVGKRVTAQAGDKTFRFYYDPSNTLDGELTGGGWEGSGAFAITDTDQICVSMAADKGRYRCLTVVRTGEGLRKYNASGKMTFELLEITPAEGL